MFVRVLLQCPIVLHDPTAFGFDSDHDVPSERQRMVDEALMLMQLRHPNVLTFYGLCIDGHSNRAKYIVVERADYTLDVMLQQLQSRGHSMSLSLLMHICRSVLSGLRHMHTGTPAVIHRDLKPDNLFCFIDSVSRKLIVKIGDVGYAREADEDGIVRRDYGGAAYYRAPEIQPGTYTITEKIDVFSFGISVCELVMCFCDVDGQATLTVDTFRRTYADRNKAIAAAVAKLKRISPELSELLRSCCELSPVKRPSSAEALLTVMRLTNSPD